MTTDSIRPSTPWTRHEVWILIILVLAAGILWVRPMPTSLWLDETVTYWIVKDGISEVLSRGAAYSGGNPFYYLIVWPFVHLLGPTEVALRLPSVLAMMGAAIFVVLLGKRFFDRETGLLAALIFSCQQHVQFEARNARTYALGSLLAFASIYLLVLLFDRRRSHFAVLYGIVASCVFHNHFVWGLLYPIQAIYVVFRWRELDGRMLRLLAVAALTLALALLPSWPYFSDLTSRSESLIVNLAPSVEEFLKQIVPVNASISTFVGAVICCLLGSKMDPSRPAIHRRTVGFLGVLMFFTPCVIFFLARYTEIKTFIPRYFLYSVGGMALLLATAWRAFGPPRNRLILTLVFAIVAVAAHTGRRHSSNDWAGISRSVCDLAKKHDRMLLLSHTGLVEAKDPTWWTHPEHKGYLNAPFSFYKVPDSVRIETLPFWLDLDGSKERLEFLAELIEEKRDPVILIGREATDAGFRSWFLGRLTPKGWIVTRPDGTWGNLVLTLITPPQ